MKESDFDLTWAAMHQHGWDIVLLAPMSKRPTGDTWHIVQHPHEMTKHYKSGGNLGLVCGPEWIGTPGVDLRRGSNVAVLDFDQPSALADMSTHLGPLLPWVKTGRGLLHCYVKWAEGLPARILWNGEKMGEIQRGPALQHVVIPPSIHPDTKLPYTWLVDPSEELPELPEAWRKHLLSNAVPDWIKEGDTRGHPDPEPWLGPSIEEIQAWARSQPGAKRRRNGIKFQCPGCHKEGRDRSRDNAIVYQDGRWGCAVDPRHRKDIATALGIVSIAQEIFGEDDDELRGLSIDDLD